MAYGYGYGIPGPGLIAQANVPTLIDPTNLVLWLRADTGVTLSSATTPAMTSWTLGNMTRTTGIADPDGGTNAVRFTDTVDVAVNHSAGGAGAVLGNAVTGPNLVDMWVRPFGTRFNFLAFQPSSGVAVYFNWSTGVFNDSSIGRVLATAAGGWYKIRLYNTGANQPDITVFTAEAVGDVTYDGAANYGLDVYQPVGTQDRVSQWNDQSGLANNATQGTAASQMLIKCYDAAGNWVPYGQGGNCEIGWPLDANKLCDLPAAVATAIAGASAPSTVFALMTRNTASASACSYFQIVGGTSVRSLQLNSTMHLLANNVADGGAPTKLFISTNVTTNNAYHTLVQSQAGTASAWFDGVADAGNGFDVSETQTNNAATCRFNFGCMGRELIVYKSALSAANRQRVENGIRARWGMLPL